MTKISYKVPQIFQKFLKCAGNNPGSDLFKIKFKVILKSKLKVKRPTHASF